MHIDFRKLGWILSVLLLLAGWALPQPGAAGGIYKWRDADGALHFGDMPPAGLDYREMDSRPPTGASDDTGEARGDVPASPAAGGGMFWKVSAEGRRASYLLGTIHSEDPRVARLSPPVRQALESADSLVLEMVPDDAALAAAASAMLYLDGRSLEDVVGEALYRRALDALAGYGIPAAAAGLMKPWAVMTTISMPKPHTGQFLDMLLYGRAVELGIPVRGLETPQEQLAVFETISEKDQVAMLKQTLDELPAIPAMLEDLTRAYANGDLDEVARLAEAAMGADESRVAADLLRRLDDERSLRMAQRLEPLLAEGNVFAAVGALHLAGPNGILRQLRQSGFQVVPVPQS